jgi:hypothetical protein
MNANDNDSLVADVDGLIVAAVAKLPGVAPRLCRLLRVEPSVVAEVAPWLAEQLAFSGVTAARDRWFVTDASLLPFYAQDCAGSAPRLMYVDARPEEISGWRVSCVTETIAGRTPASFSRDPENEFFVPRAIADQRIMGCMLEGL